VYQKTAWLAMFYMCIPSGYALGYVYGGLVSLYLVYIPLLKYIDHSDLSFVFNNRLEVILVGVMRSG
jgi:hypothetical protein